MPESNIGFICVTYSQDKEGRNIKNAYNHNFFGRYCSCDRPYPDVDDKVCGAAIPLILKC